MKQIWIKMAHFHRVSYKPSHCHAWHAQYPTLAHCAIDSSRLPKKMFAEQKHSKIEKKGVKTDLQIFVYSVVHCVHYEGVNEHWNLDIFWDTNPTRWRAKLLVWEGSEGAHDFIFFKRTITKLPWLYTFFHYRENPFVGGLRTQRSISWA